MDRLPHSSSSSPAAVHEWPVGSRPAPTREPDDPRTEIEHESLPDISTLTLDSDSPRVPALLISEEAQDLIVSYLAPSTTAFGYSSADVLSFCRISRFWTDSGQRQLYHSPFQWIVRGFDSALKNFQHLAEILQGHPDLAAHVRILDQDLFGLTWNGTAIKDVILSIVAICPHLRHAQMRVPEGDQVEEMALAMRKKSQLRTLAVVIDVEQDGLSSWTSNVAPRLRRLNRDGLHPLGIRVSTPPAPGHISTLTSFKIEFDAAPVAQSTTPLMGSFGPHLEKLRIEDRTGRSTNSELPLELFSSLSKLETFVVETGGGMTLEMLAALSVGSPRLSALDTTSRVWSGSAIESAEASAHRACSILTSMEALKTVSIVVDDFGKWESAATLEQFMEVLAPRVVRKWEVTRRRQQVEEYMLDDDYEDDSERSCDLSGEDEAAAYLRWSEEFEYWGDD